MFDGDIITIYDESDKQSVIKSFVITNKKIVNFFLFFRLVNLLKYLRYALLKAKKYVHMQLNFFTDNIADIPFADISNNPFAAKYEYTRL